MKVGKNYFEKTTFHSTEKDLALICDKILDDQKLLKLLFYPDKNCLSQPDLTGAQKISMIEKQIRITPRIKIDTEDCPIYLIILFNHFIPNDTNPEFQDNIIRFYVLCDPDSWTLNNFQLRPIKIMGEIHKLLHKQKLSGIGVTLFDHASLLTMDKQIVGYEMEFFVIHGSDDTIPSEGDINGAGI